MKNYTTLFRESEVKLPLIICQASLKGPIFTKLPLQLLLTLATVKLPAWAKSPSALLSKITGCGIWSKCLGLHLGPEYLNVVSAG